MNIPFDGNQLGELDRKFSNCEDLTNSELLALTAFMFHLHEFMKMGRHAVYAQFYALRYEGLFRCCVGRKLVAQDQLWKQP